MSLILIPAPSVDWPSLPPTLRLDQRSQTCESVCVTMLLRLNFSQHPGPRPRRWLSRIGDGLRQAPIIGLRCLGAKGSRWVGVASLAVTATTTDGSLACPLTLGLVA